MTSRPARKGFSRTAVSTPAGLPGPGVFFPWSGDSGVFPALEEPMHVVQGEPARVRYVVDNWQAEPVTVNGEPGFWLTGAPHEVAYVEAHGTGTSLGDPIEIAGLARAFKTGYDGSKFCTVGSVKSNIGHLESAAGVAAITKVILQMKHKTLVPSLHSDEPSSVAA